MIERANEAYRSHRPEEAVRLYQQALRDDPKRADVRVFLGAALLNANQTEEAGDEAKKAIASNPFLTRAHTLLGRVLAAKRLWLEAQEEFAVASKLDASDRETAYFSGRAFLDASRPEDAIRELQRAADLGARQSRVFENLGVAYAAQGDVRDAETAYRKAVELAGDDFQPLLRYGLFLFEQQRMADSETALRKALERNDNDVDVRFALARVLFHDGRNAEAAAVLERIRDLPDCRIHVLLSRIYLKQKSQIEVDREEHALLSCRAESNH